MMMMRVMMLVEDYDLDVIVIIITIE
jgi:hypothetical protein